MIKTYVKWQFFTLMYLQEGILCMKNQLNHLQNTIFSQILGNKINIFTSRQLKPKYRSCFLPVRVDLELTSFLEICIRKMAHRIK